MNKPLSRDEWLKAIAETIEAQGAQTVSVEGHGRLVLIAEDEYRLLSERKKTFKEWLLNGPRLDDVEIERDRRPARDFSF